MKLHENLGTFTPSVRGSMAWRCAACLPIEGASGRLMREHIVMLRKTRFAADELERLAASRPAPAPHAWPDCPDCGAEVLAWSDTVDGSSGAHCTGCGREFFAPLAAPAPVACPNCGGMGETTHDILTGGTEHDTEQRECDVCKGTGLAAPAPAKCATGHVWSNQFGEDWTPEHGKPCDCGAKRWRGADAVEPPPADRCEQQNPRTLEQCVRLRGHSGDHVGDIDEAVTRRIWSPASPSLRGGGIISHAEIEDARKAQE